MNQEREHSLVTKLGSVREPVNLSLAEALANAERILVEQGYKIAQRTDTMVVGERRKRSSLFRSVVLYLAVVVRSRPEGGVWITLKGDDREGVRKRQAEWRRWAENLPKVETADEGDEPEEELSRSKKRKPQAKAARRRVDNSLDKKTDIQGRDQPHLNELDPSAQKVGEEAGSGTGAWATATPWKRDPKVASGKSSAEVDAAKKRFDESMPSPDPEQDPFDSEVEADVQDKLDARDSGRARHEKENTPMASKKDLTDLIERVEAFEERLGVRLEGLFAKVTRDGRFVINGELHTRNGKKLARELKVVGTAYDSRDRVIDVNDRSFFADEFFGFEAFTMSLSYEDIPPARIRVYPAIL